MRLAIFLALATTAFAAVIASPTSQYTATSSPPAPGDLMFLRINAPKEPYHNRHVTILPESQTLGVENFTIHPESAPVLFTRVNLGSGRFALRGQLSGEDSSETPFIAAMVPTSGAGDYALMFVNTPDPSEESIANEPEACPEGFKCVADQWMGGPSLGFRSPGGGKFEPVKQASEGWIMYWRTPGIGVPHPHPVMLNMVVNDGQY